jgi:hypothetical protein
MAAGNEAVKPLKKDFRIAGERNESDDCDYVESYGCLSFTS